MSTRSRAAYLEGLAAVALALPEGAACAGAPDEFVDPSPSDVDALIRGYCHHCVIVGACRELGDSLAPHPHAVVMGARLYQAGEPADGWAA